MLDMDFKWVEDIYQKFEEICTEVDEKMYQEPLKYVEDQLQTVGANVKQFCSDIIHDVLPPSPEDSEEEIALPNKSPHADSEFVACKSIGLTSNESSKAKIGAWNPLLHLTSTVILEDGSSTEKNVAIAKSKVDMEGNPMEEALSQSDMSEEVTLTKSDLSSNVSSSTCGDADREKAYNYQSQASSCISVELTASKTSKIAEDVSSGLVNASTDVSGAIQIPSSVTICGPCESKVPDTEHASDNALSEDSAERSDDSMSEELSDDNVANPGAETIRLPHNVKLDESCVVVDVKDLSSVSYRAAKHMSFKKKLKRAFTSRMRSAKQQEYAHQIAHYGDPDARLCKEESSEAPNLISQQKLPNHDIYDSEWEII